MLRYIIQLFQLFVRRNNQTMITLFYANLEHL